MYKDFGKIFKPITEQQQKSSEEIVSKFAPLHRSNRKYACAASIALGTGAERDPTFSSIRNK